MPLETYTNLPVKISHEAVNLSSMVGIIQESKQNITHHFFALGQALALVKQKHLYTMEGFRSFHQFLADQRIDIAPTDAERFIAMTQDPQFQDRLALGLSKMLELLKLEPHQRQKLLSQGVVVNGGVKQIDQVNLNELRKATQSLKREGKIRCDRCSRWVDKVKEIDGKFYGASGAHSCYDLEMEERRELSEGRIPAPQLDQVLDTLQFHQNHYDPRATVPLQWLPESFYQLYGQLLKEQENMTGEVTLEGLHNEKEMLKKLLRLCQTRLRDIQETVQVLKELDVS